jgi:hypothetical protein
MRGRRGPRTAVRIVGSRALGIFFPHTVGSSTRIGVCRAVIGAPTVRLAEIVGAGCVALATAAAIPMRLRGRAAASGRPPPAVRAQHGNLEFPKVSGEARNPQNVMEQLWSPHAVLCQSSQIMLTECPPAPLSNTVPPPGLSTPTHLVLAVQGPEASAGKRRRHAAIDSHIAEAAPRLPRTSITALLPPSPCGR